MEAAMETLYLNSGLCGAAAAVLLAACPLECVVGFLAPETLIAFAVANVEVESGVKCPRLGYDANRYRVIQGI